MLLALAGTLIGAGLGRRYTLLVLLPALTGAGVISAMAVALRGDGLSSWLIEMLGFAITLQLAYCGSAALCLHSQRHLATWWSP
jgi:hypothetical protein